MKYFINGKKEINLSRNNIVAGGGEGTVYSKHKTAYKIYHDPANMISPLKIGELAALNKETIIGPGEIITDNTNRMVGYTMKYLSDTYNLCRLFSSSFKKKNGIFLQQLLALIEQFKADLEYVHSKNILIVDLNEMNFLTDSAFKKVYFIDVDSYQTANFKAPVIMDSIRDRHSQVFSQLTDWFSWAIITFQLLTGIHPYKGKHNQVKTMDERMQKNISVFNNEVRIPASCADLNIIPGFLKKWYFNLFEKGQREKPPVIPGLTALSPLVIQTAVVQGQVISMQLAAEYKEKIVGIETVENKRIIKTTRGVEIDGNFYPGVPVEAHFTGYPGKNGLLACWLEKGKLNVYDITKSAKIECDILGEQIMSSGERIYIKSFENVLELTFLETGGKLKVIPRTAGQVMERSTTAYDGAFFQYMLDACFVTIFPGQKRCYQIKIEKMAGYRIIDAKYENKVLMIIGYKNDLYDRFILRFDDTFSSYDIRKIKNIEIVDLNFVVLDHGAVVFKNEEEKLELFLNQKDAREVKIVDDGSAAPLCLYKDGTALLGTVENKLYKLSLGTK